VSAISADDGEIADTESHGWAAVTGWFTGGVHPVELLKNFLDPRRLAVGGALAALDGPATVDEIEERTGLPRRDVLDAIGALCNAGIVSSDAAGYRLDDAALRAAAKELADVELPMDPVIGYGMTEPERVVLSRFFHGRTLHSIPSNRAKRLIVLERLALEFDVGRRYPETEVNAILGAFNPDWSTLRRALVDEGFLDREQNVYWRAGGKVLDPPDHG
jgi:hypothetical protein